MNLWASFLRKNAKQFFLDYHPEVATWRVVSWNFDLKEPGQRNWTVEGVKTSHRSMKWSQDSSQKTCLSLDGGFLIRKKKLRPSPELKEMMNLAIHSTLKFSLEDNHSFLLSPVTGVTAVDFQNENRALKWLEATLGTVTRALDKTVGQQDLILTAAFFSGIEPQSRERVLRLLVFNLDISCYFKEDFTLQIIIFDDKNLGQGESKNPVFNQIIKVTKAQFYDEIGKLVHRIAMVGEIK